MGRISRYVFMAAFFTFFIISAAAFGQETGAIEEGNTAVGEGLPLPGSPDDLEMQWVWGEVTSLNPADNKMSLKYFDYETDKDKEIEVVADADTLFENAASLDGIRTGDNVSVDYVIKNESAGAVNLARTITLEPEEEMVPEEGNPTDQGGQEEVFMEEGNATQEEPAQAAGDTGVDTEAVQE